MFDFMLSAKLCKQISFLNLEAHLCAYDIYKLKEEIFQGVSLPKWEIKSELWDSLAVSFKNMACGDVTPFILFST